MKFSKDIVRFLAFKKNNYYFLIDSSNLVLDNFANGLRQSLEVREFEYINVKASLFLLIRAKKKFIFELILKLIKILPNIIFYNRNENYYKLINEILSLSYGGIHIGDKAYSFFLRYNPKGLGFFNLHKLFLTFLYALLYIEKIKQIYKKNNYIIYLSHSEYLNGLIERYFSKRGSYLIRAVGYPHAFSIFQSPNLDISIESYKATSVIKPKYNISIKYDGDPIDFIIKRVEEPSKIRYIKKWKNAKKDIKKVISPNSRSIFIFLHSFMDAQLFYGAEDGFPSIYDFHLILLRFLNEIKKTSKYDFKIYIKPHPNWSDDYPRDNMNSNDRFIYRSLLEQIDTSSFIFLDSFHKVKDISNLINKENSLIISHHGTIIPEACALGLTTLSSINAIWSNKYQIGHCFNSIKNLKEQIINFLEGRLPISDKEQIHENLRKLIREYYFSYPSEFECHFNRVIVEYEKKYGKKISDIKFKDNLSKKNKLEDLQLATEFIKKFVKPKKFFQSLEK